MQVTIPNWRRPFICNVWKVDDIIDIAELLFEQGFASSKGQAKQMIKNGELWRLPLDREGWIDIRENMEKCFLNQIPLQDLDVLFVGGKKDTAMCHRIFFN